MVRIKICGITNLDDALAATEAGADELGFNFYPRSPRYILPRDARRIIERLPPEVLSVGVFVNEDTPETLAQLADQAHVGAIQLHGDESPAYCRALKTRAVIKALRVGEDFDVEAVGDFATDAVLLDGYSARERGGTGQTFDWALARRTREKVAKLYLAGGLTADNVAAAIASVQPYAVDACSGVEASPGHKDVTRLRSFIEAARGTQIKP